MGEAGQIPRSLRHAFQCAEAVAVVLVSLAGWALEAQTVQHLTIAQPGGLPGWPVMSGIAGTTNGVTVTWDGPQGYYQVWQKTNLTDANWLAWGKPTNLVRRATVTGFHSNTFFRVSGPSPHYAGSAVCAQCHKGIHDAQILTAHAEAFTNADFAALGGQTNSSCLACHTVGYGLPTGFAFAVNAGRISYATNLAGVQCENCHGPAANHAANPEDPTMVPRVELAAQVCGGCHSAGFAPVSVSDWHPPYFENWGVSAHSAVVPDALAVMSASTNNISSCGRCHSGSARLALIQGQNPSRTLSGDFDVAITCAVCHDPHAQHAWTNALTGTLLFTNTLSGVAVPVQNLELGAVYTNQLRCALSSTNDFFLKTSDVFTNKYNPAVNLCAQCHNHRGAAWTDTARAPHHSPQYNMLLGTVGELATGPSPGLPATHSRLEEQCVACHMQETNHFSGHTFEVASYQLCYNCHSDPAGLVQFVTGSMAQQIQQTKSYLDLWATTRAPAALQAYGSRAWEYTEPGDLSPGGPGPDATGQTLIPDEIKKARFDLYLVLYDGSYGVHNPLYDVQLLRAAQTWIEAQLYQ